MFIEIKDTESVYNVYDWLNSRSCMFFFSLKFWHSTDVWAKKSAYQITPIAALLPFFRCWIHAEGDYAAYRIYRKGVPILYGICNKRQCSCILCVVFRVISFDIWILKNRMNWPNRVLHFVFGPLSVYSMRMRKNCSRTIVSRRKNWYTRTSYRAMPHHSRLQSRPDMKHHKKYNYFFFSRFSKSLSI